MGCILGRHTDRLDIGIDTDLHTHTHHRAARDVFQKMFSSKTLAISAKTGISRSSVRAIETSQVHFGYIQAY